MMRKGMAGVVLLGVLGIFSGCAQIDAWRGTQDAYVFTYFTKNGEDGVRLLTSRDGRNWTPLQDGQPLLAPKVGESKLTRDPCVIQGPDKRFHMVWTSGWTERGIGLAHSDDLIHWSDQVGLPVMADEPTAKNVWAPEIFYDDETKEYAIYWATTIPGRFPETDLGADHNHRIYCTTTKDFKTWTKTRLFYEPGVNVIDATIQKVEPGRYAMFIKDETLKPAAQKNLRVAFADKAQGPYGPLSAPITGKYWAEGPTATRLGGAWVVYFDKYTEGQYGAVRSTDLKTWEDISDQVHFPAGVRHGTVLRVKPDVLERLEQCD